MVVLSAVIASLATGFAAFYITTLDAWFLVSHLDMLYFAGGTGLIGLALYLSHTRGKSAP